MSDFDLPTRVSIWCDAHDVADFVVTYEDQQPREPLADGDRHYGEWEPVKQGEGTSGRYLTYRGKIKIVCEHHAPRNRKPVEFTSLAKENELIDVIAHAELDKVTLSEVRALRRWLTELYKVRNEASVQDIQRLGVTLRAVRAQVE